MINTQWLATVAVSAEVVIGTAGRAVAMATGHGQLAAREVIARDAEAQEHERQR